MFVSYLPSHHSIATGPTTTGCFIASTSVFRPLYARDGEFETDGRPLPRPVDRSFSRLPPTPSHRSSLQNLPKTTALSLLPYRPDRPPFRT